ncbi:hypothetical protein NMG60_11017066 [Bertholletia excelsa]
MAQKREKEEAELKATETLICAAPIPPPPKLSAADDAARSPETSDPQPDQIVHSVSDPDEGRSCSGESPARSDLTSPPPARSQRAAAGVSSDAIRRAVNRCSGCKRKVGLTGFRCRCGELFCSEHRYSDRHDCSFDYKAAGREAIARENPVVRAAKILKV